MKATSRWTNVVKIFAGVTCLLLVAACGPGDVDINSHSMANGTPTEQEHQLLASSLQAGDKFGRAVAIDGDLAVVGAPMDDGKPNLDAGAAYVFRRLKSGWALEQKLVAGDRGAGDRFGEAVAIEGQTIVAGAPYKADLGPYTGAAYVFERSGSSWTQTKKLASSDLTFGDMFGQAVAISGDRILIGAYRDDDNGGTSGSAYVFVRTTSDFVQEAKLLPSDGSSMDMFGAAVALKDDVALVGAFNDDANGAGSGSAYLFKRVTGWNQLAKLVPADHAVKQNFGVSVSLARDVAVVGAFLDNHAGTYSGAAYTFRKQGQGTQEVWPQEQKLTASDAGPEAMFGRSVAIEGSVVAIGAFRDGAKSGAAYTFSHDGISWGSERKLVASGGAAWDYFGRSVAISGGSIAVGADQGLASSTGAAYVYSLNRAPIISKVYQSTTTGRVEHHVTFIVKAYDPEDKALAILWAAPQGLLGAPTHATVGSESSSEIVWTAPTSPGTHTITATVEDPAGGTVQYVFNVTTTP